LEGRYSPAAAIAARITIRRIAFFAIPTGILRRGSLYHPTLPLQRRELKGKDEKRTDTLLINVWNMFFATFRQL